MTSELQLLPFSAIISSPLGNLGLRLNNHILYQLDILADSLAGGNSEDAACQLIIEQLNRYFIYPDTTFSVSLAATGTPFQQKVWAALQQIPAGKTLTYGELAKQLNSSPRAVGQACRNNPIPIIIPCHRIVASSHLGGYAGATDGRLMDIKKWLLSHEKGCLHS